ncbi:MAG TPA: hypothetical protein DGM69_01525 [Chloroflexi bacterium]|nr:hypothetical protein [Chloroflexota bacterium]|tara:strand:+ start:17 stop:211 length:195 start_codon:yes stop_codon:yes gene_type:complete
MVIGMFFGVDKADVDMFVGVFSIVEVAYCTLGGRSVKLFVAGSVVQETQRHIMIQRHNIGTLRN